MLDRCRRPRTSWGGRVISERVRGAESISWRANIPGEFVIRGSLQQPLEWKHLYRASEKMTEGEAQKVVTTVPDEEGFEAWRQHNLRFEPKSDARKNRVNGTNGRIVEFKVRIARAGHILGMQIQEMQKMIAVLRAIGPITKQHMATMKSPDCNNFYAKVMNFPNVASIG